MPRRAVQMSDKQVNACKQPGLYAVGGRDAQGLHLQVTDTGSRSWILRVTIGTRENAAGKKVQHRRDFGLGAYPGVSLADAREKAKAYRERVAKGDDPRGEVREARAKAQAERAAQMTVKAAALAYIDSMQAKWKADPKGVSKRQAQLSTYITPRIGNVLVGDVEMRDVLAVVQQPTDPKDPESATLWDGMPATAEKVITLLRNTLDWANVHGYRKGENPARVKGYLDKVLPPRRKDDNYESLPYSKLAKFMTELRQQDNITARAIEITVLSALRDTEAREAKWPEFDLDAAVWTVPAERMKVKGEDHRVPLTPSMLKVLRKLKEESTNDWVFPGTKADKPLSDGAMRALLKRMGHTDDRGRHIVTHGFRSTFSTWTSECTDHSPEVREMALAHKIKNAVEAAYRRGDLFEKRRKLMNDWDAFCCIRETR